jgi:thioredoxin-like negative regulator of GroEL
VKILQRLAFVFGLPLLVASCGARQSGSVERRPIAELRKDSESSRDPEVIARWLLGELISADGSAEQARRARKALGETGGGVLAHLARGLDDALHGRLKRVSDHYLRALQAAREQNDPNSPLFAWFAAHEAALYRHGDKDLFERWRPFLESALREPRYIGWRARAELAELWQDEAWSQAAKDVVEAGVDLHGCARNVRLAGPFGHEAPRDIARRFSAEDPGPWPQRFKSDPGVGNAPELLETEREGCYVSAKDPPGAGIFYAETFVQLDAPADVLIAVQGAYGVWVNDHRVLTRDLREWGSWPRFGVSVSLPAGRHRVLARIGEPATSVRLLYSDGRPLRAPTSTEASQPYSLAAPKVRPFANVLDPYLSGGKLTDPGDDLIRYLSAALASVESQSDAANVFMEPLVTRPERATGAVLGASALFTGADPVFSESQRRDLVRELQERAVARDPRLWHPRLALSLLEAERSGLPEAARAVKKLVGEFPDVPAIQSELARVYAELGWKAEYAKTVLGLAQNFPEDPGALERAIEVLDTQGRTAEADALVERIQKLDPDREIRLARALERRDYTTALAELERIAARRPQRKDLVERVHDVMVRAGNTGETWKKLEAAIQQDPKSEKARLDLADAGMASGKRDALVRALLDAVGEGAPTARIEEALDLVEGVSELEPYRHDALAVIREYEASGRELPGTAARVLDYAAVWVHADGSSRMLEHEIVRVQSAEAVTEMAEQPIGEGLLLHMRVIKKDGRVLEPELVEGKPTLTLPHLEVGDYFETERIESRPGDGQRGMRYLGPRWFFREENIAYARSEFVVISPKSKPLEIETRNGVPAPAVTEDGAIVVRRWRVDRSPAAPVEPFGAPIVEFLPSVQVGWGVSIERTLEAMVDASTDLSPVDPRVLRLAERIVEGVPPAAVAERAKRLYRWLVTSVEEGEENDGRRVIIGRNGNLWRGYLTLCNALRIPIEYSVAQSRLTLPPTGSFSASSQFTVPLFRVTTEQGPIWLTLGSKYAPFGYVPAEVRGMPVYALSEKGALPLRVPEQGVPDRVAYEGDVKLARDGSAEIELIQTLYGKYATALRDALSEMAAAQIRDLVETRLVGGALRGARLERHSIDFLEEPDRPLVIRSTSKVPSFAQVAGSVLLVSPPFSPRIGQLASLPQRQTPLLVVDSTDQEILLRLHLPAGATQPQSLPPREVTDGGRRILVKDRSEQGHIVLDRRITLPAGRVQVAEYPRFVRFARSADEALSASIRVRLGG